MAEAPAASGSCARRGEIVLEVLGSGGPIADDERASTGYLLWVDGRARLLVDAGGGIFQRFGAANAKLEDLEAIALTHLHVDHAGDLPALLKSGYFIERSRPLPILGPSGNERFPSMSEHARALFDADRGAYRYLSPYLERDVDGWFETPTVELAAAIGVRSDAMTFGELSIQSVGVEHGTIPAVGYRVEVRGRNLAFAGDQNANNPAFVEIARGADALVMHHAIPERSSGVVTRLHAIPSDIGRAASLAQVSELVLSHHMRRALADLEGSLAAIRAHYDGPITVAADHTCIPIP